MFVRAGNSVPAARLFMQFRAGGRQQSTVREANDPWPTLSPPRSSVSDGRFARDGTRSWTNLCPNIWRPSSIASRTSAGPRAGQQRAGGPLRQDRERPRRGRPSLRKRPTQLARKPGTAICALSARPPPTNHATLVGVHYNRTLLKNRAFPACEPTSFGKSSQPASAL